MRSADKGDLLFPFDSASRTRRSLYPLLFPPRRGRIANKQVEPCVLFLPPPFLCFIQRGAALSQLPFKDQIRCNTPSLLPFLMVVAMSPKHSSMVKNRVFPPPFPFFVATVNPPSFPSFFFSLPPHGFFFGFFFFLFYPYTKISHENHRIDSPFLFPPFLFFPFLPPGRFLSSIILSPFSYHVARA